MKLFRVSFEILRAVGEILEGTWGAQDTDLSWGFDSLPINSGRV